MKKRKRLISISVIILILTIFIFKNNKNQEKIFQDELIFFKIFSLAQKENNNTLTTKEGNIPIYKFNVQYKNTNFRNVSITDTIDKETLLYGKIAPRNKRRI